MIYVEFNTDNDFWLKRRDNGQKCDWPTKFSDRQSFRKWIINNMHLIEVKFCANWDENTSNFESYGHRMTEVMKLFDYVYLQLRTQDDGHFCCGNWSVTWSFKHE